MELKHSSSPLVCLRRSLLIVPYGIETWILNVILQCLCLLIVPYGIETIELDDPATAFMAFNRTLWN